MYYIDMNEYKFTQNWFNFSEIKKLLHLVLNPNNMINMLEIGCFEGQSSVFFSDNYLNHNESRLTCIDPFLSVNNNDHSEFLQNNEEINFDHNIKLSKNFDKIKIHKITSDDFFKFNNNTFDFIYIDGCHLPEYIERDMINSFNCLNKNGIMWMDDYRGGSDGSIKQAMDKILNLLEGKYTLLHSNYQLVIKKL
jgi:predicted O-methyltransferase YrrM